jgi:penicillin-binding protein 1C
MFFVVNTVISISHVPYAEYGSLTLLDSNGIVITEKWKAWGYMIPYSGSLDIPLIQAIIRIEDARFYNHHGVDILAKLGAIRENLQAGTIVRWGSTLTEQYVKNMYFAKNERTIIEKIRESIGAVSIETTERKDEILKKYLNSLYFWNKIYWLGSALASYFPGRNPENITEDEILDLITRIRSPNIDEGNIEQALEYRSRMATRLGISVGESWLLEHTRTTYKDNFPLLTARIEQWIRSYCRGNKRDLEKFTLQIPNNLCESNSQTLILSIDTKLMQFVSTTLDGTLTPLWEKNVTNGAIYIYHPTKEKVLAYVASRPGSSAVDMIQERRSVGSILKPFVYLLALRDGADSESLIMDTLQEYPTGYDEKVFVPQNYVPKSYGPIRLREALGNSLNSATVRISEEIGIGKIYDFFRSVGLDMEHDAGYYGYGISIGTVELTLENVVESFSHLLRTEDKNIFLIEQILRDPKNRAKTFGISSILNTSIPLPVKTGTSTDFRDNWVVSYHPNAIIGVWIGNNDASPMQDISGVSGAGPLWHRVAEYMIANRMIYKIESDIPEGIQEIALCLDARCLQKELQYSKKTTSPKSRILNNIYYNEDFYTPLMEEEIREWNVR